MTEKRIFHLTEKMAPEILSVNDKCKRVSKKLHRRMLRAAAAKNLMWAEIKIKYPIVSEGCYVVDKEHQALIGAMGHNHEPIYLYGEQWEEIEEMFDDMNKKHERAMRLSERFTALKQLMWARIQSNFPECTDGNWKFNEESLTIEEAEEEVAPGFPGLPPNIGMGMILPNGTMLGMPPPPPEVRDAIQQIIKKIMEQER